MVRIANDFHLTTLHREETRFLFSRNVKCVVYFGLRCKNEQYLVHSKIQKLQLRVQFQPTKTFSSTTSSRRGKAQPVLVHFDAWLLPVEISITSKSCTNTVGAPILRAQWRIKTNKYGLLSCQWPGKALLYQLGRSTGSKNPSNEVKVRKIRISVPRRGPITCLHGYCNTRRNRSIHTVAKGSEVRSAP